MSRFARVVLLAILLTLSAKPAMADWTQDFVRIACNPDARFFRFEWVGLDGSSTWSDAQYDDKRMEERKAIWRQHGFYVPSDLHYECKVGDAIYRLTTKQQAPYSPGMCGEQPPIKLNLTKDGEEILKDVTFGDDCFGGPSVASVTIFETLMGWGGADTSMCAWPKTNSGSSPYKEVCEDPSAFSRTMPVTQEQMGIYLRKRSKE
ncbi:hypothetical protein ACTHR6_19555 [Ralstonia holmesii]|uniref:hypothetical protein n=1 Tax=Ralstonia TaxID=48736 RepID=UPI00046A2E31|nr:hypothetical protein [Ralstonia pickettii]